MIDEFEKTPTIDAHQHFWDRTDTRFDYSWQESSGMEDICRSFLPNDLKPLLESSSVDYSVFVQTQHDLEENRWALDLADQFKFICGVVGWVDLSSENAESQVEEFQAFQKFVGARHVIQDEPDPDFVIRADVGHGLAILERHGLPFDLLFYDHHLKHAATIGRRFPNLKLVIDHLAKPKIKTGDIDQWKKDISEAASCPNMFCKLSGMITEADWIDWKLEDFRPYVDHALECFGVERLMFGSDWPVCCLAGKYSQVVSLAKACLEQLSSDEQAWVFGKTAVEFYDLQV